MWLSASKHRGLVITSNYQDLVVRRQGFGRNDERGEGDRRRGVVEVAPAGATIER